MSTVSQSKVKNQQGNTTIKDVMLPGFTVKEVTHINETDIKDMPRPHTAATITSSQNQSRRKRNNVSHGGLSKSVYGSPLPQPQATAKPKKRRKPLAPAGLGRDQSRSITTATIRQPLDTPSVPTYTSTQQCKESLSKDAVVKSLSNVNELTVPGEHNHTICHPSVIVSSSTCTATTEQDLAIDKMSLSNISINTEKSSSEYHCSSSLEGPNNAAFVNSSQQLTNHSDAALIPNEVALGEQSIAAVTGEFSPEEVISENRAEDINVVEQSQQTLEEAEGRSQGITLSKIVSVALMAKQWKSRLTKHLITGEEEPMDEAEAQEKLEQALPKEMISKVQQEALLLLSKSESIYKSYLGHDHVLTKKAADQIQYLETELGSKCNTTR